MVVRIDGRDFRVVVTARPIIRWSEARDAWLDVPGRRLLISDEVAPDRRWWVALQTLKDQLDGDPMGFDAVVEQLEAQGGKAGLAEMQPDASPLPPTAAARSTGGRATCCCGADVMCGSIVNDDKEWNATLGCFTLRRTMLCNSCDRVMRWREQCDQAGQPLGEYVGGQPPAPLAAAEAAGWLEAHPHIARVVGSA